MRRWTRRSKQVSPSLARTRPPPPPPLSLCLSDQVEDEVGFVSESSRAEYATLHIA
eukprot:COSAG03_NODE_29700_length_179_cov_11.437500_1_plen_55_part_01